MKESTPRTTYLKDYRPPDFLIDRTELRFELGEEGTRVQARLLLRRAGVPGRPLVLDGQGLQLVAMTLDGEPLAAERYSAGDDSLTITEVPDRFTLEVDTLIHPESNTELEGLFKSAGNFCTQCEAEGFRKITYYLDRPDVMARFSTTIVADSTRYPVLLSNGNRVAGGELDDGRHWVRWEDPFPKPCYLFALVAGDLACVEERYTTRSGRDVALRLYVEHGNEDRCAHALRSLQQAMEWDEQTFGLEYDLDVYMIVAVGDFNMGAMENKGLNIFNTKYVLARADTATDADYRGIAGVIAHEYFHNWTGNRVTCRDWFQLSLKEGLTVFRDQEFSADTGSRAVQRIGDVRMLRSAQFQEDSGPMAHPVRPNSYIEINNFYTTTVYNKGAEVVRMIRTLVGTEGFRRGMDLYFARHDGQAVTCDDFVAAMEAASHVDLGQFRRWYSQAGTPVVRARGRRDAATGSYCLELSQHCPATPGQPDKEPFHIPLSVGFVASNGKDLPLRLEGEEQGADTGTRVLHLRKSAEKFRFVNIPEGSVPSLLRGFSAPVRLEYEYSPEQLAFQLRHDGDPFNRWEAGQRLATRAILELVASFASERTVVAVDQALVEALASVLADSSVDRELRALILDLPSESYLGEQLEMIDPQAIHQARSAARQAVADALRGELLACYRENEVTGPYSTDAASIGRRALRNRCLSYLALVAGKDGEDLCQQQFAEASNMTDSLAALALIADGDAQGRAEVLERFYQRWKSDPLVLDKWFAIQALSSRDDTLARVRALLEHPAFSLRNPNKVRALIGTFASQNTARFHAEDGEGYLFLADQVLRLDALNPQVAARAIQPLTRWRRYAQKPQSMMRTELQRVLATGSISRDVYEVVAKGLG
jgi:aminopeptidase N